MAARINGRISAVHWSQFQSQATGASAIWELWERFSRRRRKSWLWFYASLQFAVTPKHRPPKSACPKLKVRSQPWAARKMRVARPVSAAGLHPDARAKASASFLAATLTASIPAVAAVAMVDLWIFFVRWAHVPNTHRLPPMR